jgi:hypothetical protein
MTHRLHLLLIFSIVVLVSHQTIGQNRMYLTLSGGAAFGIEERGYSYAPGPAYGLTWTSESRISGWMYSLIGLGLEYTNNQQDQYEYFESSVQQTSLTMPLLIRINSGNSNRIYLDIGLMPSYIVNCNLYETGFNNTQFEGEVSSDISPLRLAFILGSTYSFGVFNLGWQVSYKLIDGNTAELAKKWEGAGSSSTFVENTGNSHGAIFSLTAGFRIK